MKALEAVAESALTESALAGSPLEQSTLEESALAGAKPFAEKLLLRWRPMRREQSLQHPMRAQDLPAVSWRP